MIRRSAIEDFLSAPMRNSRTAKKFTNEQLDRKLRRLDPRPDFHTDPMWHQKIAFLLGARYQHYLYLLDMGLGKTKLSLDLYKWARDKSLDKKCLVLVPYSTNVGSWRDEVEIHAPDLRCGFLDVVGTEVRLQEIEQAEDLVVVTYAGWQTLVCGKVPDKKRKGRNKRVINKRKATRLERQFGMVVFDESSFIRKKGNLTFRMCNRLAKVCDWRYALTGTPIDKRGPEDYWSQFFLVDRGLTLGETLGMFREAFCKETEHPYTGYPVYTVDPKKKAVLQRRLQNRSIRFASEDCLDLPPMVGGVFSKRGPMIRSVSFTSEGASYMEKLRNQVRVAQGYSELESTYHLMRQLASGYMTLEDSEGDRHSIELRRNPKMVGLLDLLDEIPEDRKVIVGTVYKYTGKMVCEALEKAGHRYVRVYGGTPNKNEVVSRFKKDKKTRILVGSEAIAYGLNLQVANYLAMFETPDKWTVRKQIESRMRRPGQKRKMFVYDFVVRGSIEEKILAGQRDGRDVYDEFVEGKVYAVGKKKKRPKPKPRPKGGKKY